MLFQRKPKTSRRLKETESTLETNEVDEYFIQSSSPNILREGDIDIVLSVLLNPKDKNGNFPSALSNYTLIVLKKLFTVSNSKNASFFFQVINLSNKKLVMSDHSPTPGEIYICSKYFTNVETYIIKITTGFLFYMAMDIYIKH